MINRIYINRFHRVNEVVINGITHRSEYNYNYYYNEINDVLILEECNDDMFFIYSIVNEDGRLEHLGNHFGVLGIFDKDNHYLDCIEDNNGEQYVEVDTERC